LATKNMISQNTMVFTANLMKGKISRKWQEEILEHGFDSIV